MYGTECKVSKAWGTDLVGDSPVSPLIMGITKTTFSRFYDISSNFSNAWGQTSYDILDERPFAAS